MGSQGRSERSGEAGRPGAGHEWRKGGANGPTISGLEKQSAEEVSDRQYMKVLLVVLSFG